MVLNACSRIWCFQIENGGTKQAVLNAIDAGYDCLIQLKHMERS